MYRKAESFEDNIESKGGFQVKIQNGSQKKIKADSKY
jgi:hypothetical protein